MGDFQASHLRSEGHFGDPFAEKIGGGEGGGGGVIMSVEEAIIPPRSVPKITQPQVIGERIVARALLISRTKSVYCHSYASNFRPAGRVFLSVISRTSIQWTDVLFCSPFWVD